MKPGEPSIISSILRPAALVYGMASSLRTFAYKKGWRKQVKVPATVISVGNITCGGTGKTTLVANLATQYIKAGHRVGILSRGYKRKSKEPYVVVSDGTSLTATVDEAGDEPYLLTQIVPGATVIVGAKRVVTAAMAIDAFHCDVLILDDGFQHLPLARNCDVVLVDYHDNLTLNRLLPAGRLREPLGALQRADWVVITKVPKLNYEAGLSFFTDLIHRWAPAAKIAACRYVPKQFSTLGSTSNNYPLETFIGVKALAFTGIAQPQQFFAQLKELGINVVATNTFPDHHWYNQADLAFLKTRLAESGAQIALTTHKDFVKLDSYHQTGLPISYLEIGVEWLTPLPNLVALATKSAFASVKG